MVNSSYRELKTKTYVLSLLDRDGKENKIEAIGIPTITDTGPAGEMSEIRKLFPEAPEEVFTRPIGKVDIMLGLPARRLHATTGITRQDLRLDRSSLGCGWG